MSDMKRSKARKRTKTAPVTRQPELQLDFRPHERAIFKSNEGVRIQAFRLLWSGKPVTPNGVFPEWKGVCYSGGLRYTLTLTRANSTEEDRRRDTCLVFNV